jgi:hypothetical protein
MIYLSEWVSEYINLCSGELPEWDVFEYNAVSVLS